MPEPTAPELACHVTPRLSLARQDKIVPLALRLARTNLA
jgi:hypothetical protein